MSLSNVYNLPLGLSIQKGLVQNYTGVNKFGLNTAVVIVTGKPNGKL